jgi:hypothetical protein
MSNKCKPTIEQVFTIECAIVCDYSPISEIDLTYSGFTLTVTNASDFFELNWIIYHKNQIIYEFGWNNPTTVMTEFSNGSTYSNFYFGINNTDVFILIDTLPIFYTNEVFKIGVKGRNQDGIESSEIIKYQFSK